MGSPEIYPNYNATILILICPNANGRFKRMHSFQKMIISIVKTLYRERSTYMD